MTIVESKDGNSSKPSPCQQCVEMLKQVLMAPGSRPRALLESMGSSCDFRLHENGVLVTLGEKDSETHTDTSNIIPAAKTATTTTSSSMSWETNRLTKTLGNHVTPLAASAKTPPTTSLKIECRPCGSLGPEGGARAFVMGPTPLSIVVCSNRLHTLGEKHTDEMEQVLVHELIHIYDVKMLQMDLRTCTNLAYSEVRAAREAECHGSWVQPYCVKQKAITATHNMFPSGGRECIRQVFDQAMADTRPFPKRSSMVYEGSRPSDR